MEIQGEDRLDIGIGARPRSDIVLEPNAIMPQLPVPGKNAPWSCIAEPA
ncbi:hypothetical protein [Aureimonas glaciei]|jgi:hypothetical protein|nr:hypothetical protein [Aureimonas glaciei]